MVVPSILETELAFYELKMNQIFEFNLIQKYNLLSIKINLENFHYHCQKNIIVFKRTILSYGLKIN